MSEDPIERIFMERATLREIGADMANYRPTQTGYEPASPVPESLPILGGNEMQGYPAEEADTAERTMEFNSSEGLVGAMQMLSEGFGAGIQQYKINEVEKRIADKTLTPLDHIQAVVENPNVPLGDYYDASTNTFSNVPSDDYILHQGQLYPRVITDAEGNQVDLSEDNMLINFGRMLMDSMLDPLEGVGVGTRAAAQLIKGGAPDPNTLGSGIVPGATTGAQTADDVSDIGFYSEVSRAVDALPMDKGSASQMRAMIAKTPGVKPEEMAWIGLDDFLRGKKSVTKAEVQEYVQANQVQIQEVVKGDLDTANIRVELIDGEHHLINDEGEIIDTYPGDAQGALDAVNAIPPNTNRPLSDTKFASYTLPGGENYREVLLTLPERGGPVDDRTPLQTAKDLFGDNIESISELHLDQRDILQRELNKQYKQGEKRLADNFTSGHFDEPNVLAHMRLNDRTGPNGERILFIEEIQSDWHQKGRDKGYKTPENTATETQINERINSLLDQEMSLNDDLFTKYNLGGTALPDGNGVSFYSRDIIENNDYKVIGRVFTNGSFYVDEAFGANNPAIADRIKELAEISAERGQLKQQRSNIPNAVPDAPLKKTWHEMSFRRVARMAAEEGYDAIAWTPGKMQAERYNLSKQIDELRYRQNDDGTFDIVPVRNGNTIQAEEFEGVSKDRLSDVVGKEVAEKMVKGEGESDPGTNAQTLRGLDLEVGGAGMEGFYDQMLKTYAAKWGKKFGAKVGVSPINADGPASVLEAVETPSGEFVVMDRVNGGQLANFETQQAADNFIKNEMADTEVWTLPVTKKMRDSIMSKGIPTFAVGGAVAMSQVERDQNGN